MDVLMTLPALVTDDAARLARFFDTARNKHTVKPSVARFITFKQLNLMHELPLHGHSGSLLEVSDHYGLVGTTIYQRIDIEA